MLQKPNKVRATQQSLHYTVFLPRWCRLSLEARESVNLLLPWLSVQLNRFPSVNVIPIYNSDYIGPIDWKAPIFCYFRGNYSVYQCCTLKLPIFVLNQSIFGWDMTKMLNRHFSILCLNVDAQINLEMINLWHTFKQCLIKWGFWSYLSQILMDFAQIWFIWKVSCRNSTNPIPQVRLIRFPAPRSGIGSVRINWESDTTLDESDCKIIDVPTSYLRHVPAGEGFNNMIQMLQCLNIFI